MAMASLRHVVPSSVASLSARRETGSNKHSNNGHNGAATLRSTFLVGDRSSDLTGNARHGYLTTTAPIAAGRTCAPIRASSHRLNTNLTHSASRSSRPSSRGPSRAVAAAAAVRGSASPVISASSSGSPGVVQALVFDCDGVILESEDLHRQAYNATFKHFLLRCPGEGRGAAGGVEWTTEFYDVLQNQIGGGKPKMRWYFNKNGWPHSSLLPSPPATDADKDLLIDTLQDWKTSKYKELIGSGQVPVRPGVLETMDEARRRGLLVAVCSAATKSSVVFTLTSLLGRDRFERLDCFLAGDDVDKKKPDPTIYRLAAERLNLPPSACLVVEDSVIGLKAATGAGMRCVITHTPSTRNQNFSGAAAILENLGGVTLDQLLAL